MQMVNPPKMPQICAGRVGSALDLNWLPLPWPVGGGSVLGVALRDGSIALIDTCQVRGWHAVHL